MAEATTSAAGLEVRAAVRASLAELPSGARVLVACSGGADSLALAAAAAFVGPRMGQRIGGITVDHGLQDGSAARARTVAATMTRLGLDPVESWHGRYHVGAEGRRSGPEADARDLRRRLLLAAAQRHDAAAVLLGHTRDDQAETVLLGLARGSGARSLGGMRPVSGPFRRPMLGLPRDVVRAAVPPEVDVWEDPHNADDAYTRSRVRHGVLPVLETKLGPGVAAALARSAELLRADADALDAAADDAWPKALDDQDLRNVVVLRLDVLKGLPPAIRTRLLRRAALAAGSPATDLTATHVAAVETVISSGRGGAGVDLPGRVRVTRRGTQVTFTTASRGTG